LHQRKKKSVSAQKSPLLWLMLLGPLGACGAPTEVEVDAPVPPPVRTCGENGSATASLFGSIDGTLFCVAPLGEINGDAAISIPEFSFSAIVNWDK
jgi:hypothetical protein